MGIARPFRQGGATGEAAAEEAAKKKTEQEERERHKLKMLEPLVIIDKVVYD